VDNSSLTGESEPQWRSAVCTSENALLTDNLVFYSTFCVEGWAKGVVINTGDMGVVGRLAAYSFEHERKDTPISQAGLEKTRVFYKKKTSPVGFFGFFGVF
jgi:sodium/potassium-transporting ATPase subunit alpha